MTGTNKDILAWWARTINHLQALKGTCLPVESERKISDRQTKEYADLMGQRDMLACWVRKKNILQALKGICLTVG